MSIICILYSLTPELAREVVADPDRLDDILEALTTFTYLDKSWHGLHFTLTGTAWGEAPPLDFLVADRGKIAGSDTGYGPARLLDPGPGQVAELDRALAAITPEEFDRRFDTARMAADEIYSPRWDGPRGYLLAPYLEHLDNVKDLISSAVGQGRALIIVFG